jgi:hypothetical protein
LQPCTLDPSENRRWPRGRKWVPRALVHTLRRRLNGYATACLAGLLMLGVPLSGCTHLTEYIHNGFKVGPNYRRPLAPAAKNWIDAADARVRNERDDLRRWWTVFNDPVLDALVCDAYLQKAPIIDSPALPTPR